MTYDQVVTAIDLYEVKLKEQGAESIEVPHDRCPTSRDEELNHALSMVPRMRSFIVLTLWQWFLQEIGVPPRLILGKKWEKVMRWLGFLQGVFWSSDVCVFTLNKLKDHNR